MKSVSAWLLPVIFLSVVLSSPSAVARAAFRESVSFHESAKAEAASVCGYRLSVPASATSNGNLCSLPGIRGRGLLTVAEELLPVPLVDYRSTGCGFSCICWK
ncbi:CRISPR-associated RAMP protein, Cmr1 family [Anopheles sinensis]|uniref:CRISPR-associated RAMP protein, Cmr1 family n=1 Tax=Anopheles sinensis TaxID=74873 RepID=A0A084WU67_ANOSI|nr:CRISPR-associated RAMP protein, Cmr1 family [Anopheles sinensis]